MEDGEVNLNTTEHPIDAYPTESNAQVPGLNLLSPILWSPKKPVPGTRLYKYKQLIWHTWSTLAEHLVDWQMLWDNAIHQIHMLRSNSR